MGESDCRNRPRAWCAAGSAALMAAAIPVAAVLIFFVDVPVARLIAENQGACPRWIDSILDGSRHYGQAFSAIFIFLAMLSLDRTRRRAALILALAVIISALLATLAKPLISRGRPYIFIENGRMWWFFKGFERSDYCSLPSAHAASAFALSAALSRNYPRAAWVFFLAAGLCGVSRITDLQHYISDVFLGAAIGTWIGYGAYRWRWAGRAAERLLAGADSSKGRFGGRPSGD